nr:hypothetical protein [Chloroflexota bacterium]
EEIYSEWSVNEKVAMDVAIGAAYAGRRVMVTMQSPRQDHQLALQACLSCPLAL